MKKLIILLFLLLSINLFSQNRYLLNVKEVYIVENPSEKNEEISRPNNIDYLILEFNKSKINLKLFSKEKAWTETFYKIVNTDQDDIIIWRNDNIIMTISEDFISLKDVRSKKLIVLIL